MTIGSAAAVATRTPRRGGRSRDAASVFHQLARMPPEMRWDTLRTFDHDELTHVFRASRRDAGSAYALWQDDPVAFHRMVLMQSAWSAQSQALAGLVTHRRVAVPSAYATGKALALDTPLPTPTGWTTMGDVAVGDELLTEYGQPVRVTYVSPVWLTDCYRVRFTDGTSLVTSADHVWTALRCETLAKRRRQYPRGAWPHDRHYANAWDEAENVTTAGMVSGKWAIPVTRPLTLPAAELPIGPYTLGYWLGDGTTAYASITVGHADEPSAAAQITAEGYGWRERPSQRRAGCSGYGVLGLQKQLRLAGLLGCKRIPRAYLRADEATRRAVLAGLLDSDGFRTNGLTASVGIDLSDGPLAADVVELMRTLGMQPRVQTGVTGSGRTRWRIAVTPDRCPFRLPRKAAGWRAAVTAKQTARFVSAVERVPTVGTRCLTVDSPTHLYLAGDGMVPTHNTFIAASGILHGAACWPVGTSTGVTTATRFRQVKRQVWPEIKTLHRIAGLPGTVDTAQLKMPNADGEDDVVAYGLSVPANDESAAQGIHARGRLLLVVDEAGGIAKQVGRAFRGLLTGEHTALLAIGNPPTDDSNSWFEELCTTDDVLVVRIPVEATPNFTGERTGRCYVCPAEVTPHSVASHLVDKEWERDTARDYGLDSAYYQAKALARFVKVAVRATIPSAWVDTSVERAAAGTGEAITVRDPLTGVPARAQPSPGAWVRLGVDVAADGGDELVIARSEGRISRIVHTSSGADNAHPMNVAGDIKEAIADALALRERLGTPNAPEWALRVKIDVIGLGWNVWGILDAWNAEGLLGDNVIIVPVDVREGIDAKRKKRNESTLMKPRRKRDELWLAGRADLQLTDGEPEVLLDVDARTAAQLTWPDYSTDSGGLTVIESKDHMKRNRGLGSPDRAEAILLARYEPSDDLVPRKSRLILSGA